MVEPCNVQNVPTSTKTRDDLNYHIVKKHCAAGPRNNHTCKECSIEFPNFYSLRRHKQRYQTTETTSSGEEGEMLSLADAGDDKSLEDLQSCRNFLVDCEKKGNIVCSILLPTILQLKLSKNN